jgi:hypothetical protein
MTDTLDLLYAATKLVTEKRHCQRRRNSPRSA